MAHRDIVVIGASAGGVEALQALVRSLGAGFPASVFVTVHFPEHGESLLPRILSRAGPLPAVHAADGESIVRGRIYVAPPDSHLLLEPGRVRLVRGPKENGHRPAIDPMFRSAALAFGPRVIGVVLTGMLDDGTSGLSAIKRRGGLAVVQDPEDAIFPSMPGSALAHVAVDRVVTLRHLGRVLTDLLAEDVPDGEIPISPRDTMENELSAGNLNAIQRAEEHPGQISAFGCPDCGGVLWELHDGEFVRFRCRVGHGWTGDALLAKQGDAFDDALWTALRALEESASLSRRMAERHRVRGLDTLAMRLQEQAEGMDLRAAIIRDSLLERHSPAEASDAEDNPRAAS